MKIYDDKRRNTKDPRVVGGSEVFTMAIMGLISLGFGIYYACELKFKYMGLCLGVMLICVVYILLEYLKKKRSRNLAVIYNDIKLSVQTNTYIDFFENSGLDLEKFDSVFSGFSCGIAYSINEDFFFEMEVTSNAYFFGIELTNHGVDNIDKIPSDLLNYTEDFKEYKFNKYDTSKDVIAKFVDYINTSKPKVDNILGFYNAELEELNLKKEIKKDIDTVKEHVSDVKAKVETKKEEVKEFVQEKKEAIKEKRDEK